MAGQRAFNGLSGAELRTLFGKELDQALRSDPRFDGDGPLKVAWTWILSVEEGDPRTPKTWAVNLSGNVSAASGAAVRGKIAEALADHLSRDQRFAQHLTYPRVTWEWRLPMEITRVEPPLELHGIPANLSDGNAPPAVMRPDYLGIARGSVDPERSLARREGSEAGVVARREAAQRLEPGIVVDAQGNRFRLVPVQDERPALTSADAGGWDRGELRRPSPGDAEQLHPANAAIVRAEIARVEAAGRFSEAEILREAYPGVADPPEHVSRFRTGTGLPIEGGALPSPGAAAAQSHSGGSPVGAVAGPVDLVELSQRHPSLADGGMGSPDQVRRAGGLPVPSPTKTRGSGLVDLPNNSF